MPPDAVSPSSARFVRAGVIASVVSVFAVIVTAVTVGLRADLRAQILRREAKIFANFVAKELDRSAEGLSPSLPISEIPGTLLAAVLNTLPQFPDVVGVQVFDPQKKQGGFYPFQRPVGPPGAGLWSRLESGESIGTLRARVAVDEDIVVAPAFEVWVPLKQTHSSTLLGAAQFLIDGRAVAAEMNAHDRRLLKQAVIAWIGGSIAIVLALSWAFRRLDAANRELRDRTEDLERANRELVLAAKTSALGAVTAHLMHELKNPLAGLETIVRGQGDAGAANAAGGELAAASELTRRLRTMVNDVIGVLRDEQTGADFQLTSVDIAEVAAGKVRAEAEQRGVTLQTMVTGEVAFPARRANLATLVLRNLLQNAVEASSTGETVRLTARKNGAESAEFLVEDYGRGLPAAVRAKIFQPCASTKAGGSGLGLALSYQLAQQAGGRLEMVRSDELGTCFRLVLAGEA